MNLMYLVSRKHKSFVKTSDSQRDPYQKDNFYNKALLSSRQIKNGQRKLTTSLQMKSRCNYTL